MLRRIASAIALPYPGAVPCDVVQGGRNVSPSPGAHMNDPRNAQLAAVIVSHSLGVEPGEVVLIEAFDLASGLPNDLVDAIHGAGGIPLLYLRSQALVRQLMRRGDEREIGLRAQVEMSELRLA